MILRNQEMIPIGWEMYCILFEGGENLVIMCTIHFVHPLEFDEGEG